MQALWSFKTFILGTQWNHMTDTLFYLIGLLNQPFTELSLTCIYDLHGFLTCSL